MKKFELIDKYYNSTKEVSKLHKALINLLNNYILTEWYKEAIDYDLKERIWQLIYEAKTPGILERLSQVEIILLAKHRNNQSLSTLLNVTKEWFKAYDYDGKIQVSQNLIIIKKKGGEAYKYLGFRDNFLVFRDKKLRITSSKDGWDTGNVLDRQLIYFLSFFIPAGVEFILQG